MHAVLRSFVFCIEPSPAHAAFQWPDRLRRRRPSDERLDPKAVAVTVSELSRILYDLNVPNDIYRLDGSHFELAHVLAREGSRWVVFLSERGGQSDRAEFDDEHDACMNLFGRVCLELVERGQLAVIPDESAPGG